MAESTRLSARNSERETLEQASAKSRLKRRSLSATRVNVRNSFEHRGHTSGTLRNSVDAKHQLPEDHIILNVGGIKYQTTKQTLLKIPSTVLAQLAEQSLQDERPDCAYEYYFDRSPVLFDSVLNYYRTGELHFGHNVCPSQIKVELEFWKIGEVELSDCCWLRYLDYWEKQRDRQTLSKIIEPQDKFQKTLKTMLSWLPEGLTQRSKLLHLSFISGRSDFFFYVLTILSTCLVFGIFIRLVEPADSISSILVGAWWALVTMTTVGYGDTHPKTNLGILIGSVCAIYGVVLVAIVIPRMAEKYISWTERLADLGRLQNRDRIKERKKQKKAQ